jgi:flagellar biosynthetic protein FliO
VISSTAAQSREDVGKFDIDKVREAVESSQMEAGGDSVLEESGQARQHAESLSVIIGRIIGYLVLVIVLILGVFWVLRKTGMIGASRIGGGSMDVLEALALGQGRHVLLVRVMDTVLVLAQTPQNITLLEKVQGEKALELIASTKGGTSVVQFKDMFNSFMGKMKKSS